MAEFAISAFARYPDGSTGDAFAVAQGATPKACFAAIADEIHLRVPPARPSRDAEDHDAIELVLSWSEGGEESSSSSPPPPPPPPDRGEAKGHPASARSCRLPGRGAAACLARHSSRALPLNLPVRASRAAAGGSPRRVARGGLPAPQRPPRR
jgi:hypothetical protein